MNKLKEKMQSVGISAYRLAKLSGVSQATISRMKKGENCTKENWDAVWEVLYEEQNTVLGVCSCEEKYKTRRKINDSYVCGTCGKNPS